MTAQAHGCWIDRLTPEELGDLDPLDRMIVVDELRFRGKQMQRLQDECSLVAALITVTPIPPVRDLDTGVLADQIAERVAERLGSGRTADIYTTRKGGPHAPGKSRDWMLRRVKEMPGARKIGKDWQITRADFERWVTEQDMTSCKAVPPRTVKTTPNNVRDIAEAALARAGLRPTK
jgi:hypothetical protein